MSYDTGQKWGLKNLWFWNNTVMKVTLQFKHYKWRLGIVQKDICESESSHWLSAHDQCSSLVTECYAPARHVTTSLQCSKYFTLRWIYQDTCSPTARPALMSAFHVRDMHAINHANNVGEVEKVIREKKKKKQYSIYDTNWMSSDRRMERERKIFIISSSQCHRKPGNR